MPLLNKYYKIKINPVEKFILVTRFSIKSSTKETR
ncbi:CRPV-047 [Crowpox virus]|nr:CRPV-047 [Crowpox virus]